MLLCSSLEGQFDHGLGFDVTTGNRYQNTLIFYGSVCLTFVDFLRQTRNKVTISTEVNWLLRKGLTSPEGGKGVLLGQITVQSKLVIR